MPSGKDHGPEAGAGWLYTVKGVSQGGWGAPPNIVPGTVQEPSMP